MSPRHRQNRRRIDNAVVFCIFSDLDIAVDDFKFFITLLIVDRFALYFVLRFVAIYLVTSGVSSEVEDMLSVSVQWSAGISFCFVVDGF